MYTTRVVTDLAECQALWHRVMPRDTIADLWEVRECFQRHFLRPASFIVAEDGDRVRGLLPLSWIEESDCFGCFPGETWEGKTWLEQNRILAHGPTVLASLLALCPAPYHLRYLLPVDGVAGDGAVVDEIGYLFLPPRYGFDVESYFGQELSHKFAKKLKRDIRRVEELGVSYRLDELADFDHLVRLNVERFGERSYFADERFRESFRDLMHLLHRWGCLRMTTVLIAGEPAAVDMGCVYRGVYTLVAGGTHGDYRGVAKLINVHHMQRACRERLEQVDFLCGDFSWKTLFRLAPRPLYLLSNAPVAAPHHSREEVVEAAGVS
jgi:hypothetical protein